MWQRLWRHRFTQMLNWLVQVSLYWSLAWYGFQGHPGASNLFRFLVWLLLLATGLLYLVSFNPDFRRENREKLWSLREGKVPKWLDMTSDFAGAFFLAYHGWLFTPLLVILQMTLQQGIYHNWAQPDPEPEGFRLRGRIVVP